MGETLKKTRLTTREINTSIQRSGEAITQNKYDEVFGKNLLSQQTAQNMTKSTQGIFSERYGTKIPKKLDTTIDNTLKSLFVRQTNYELLELSKRVGHTKEKIKTQKHLMSEQNAFLAQRAVDMDVQRQYLDGDTADRITNLFSEDERQNMQSLLVGDNRTSTQMIAHLRNISKNDDPTMLGDEYLSVLELINENIDMKDFEFTSDQQFASEYAKKYDLICKGASADVFLKRLQNLVNNGSYPLADSVAGIQAKVEMCKKLKTFYEDMIAFMTSPYYALLEEKDLESFLGDDWEQRMASDVKAAHSAAFKEFVRTYRSIRTSEYGKNRKLSDMHSALTQQYKEDSVWRQTENQVENSQINARQNIQEKQQDNDEGEVVQTRKRRGAHGNVEAMYLERNKEVLSHGRKRRDAIYRKRKELSEADTQRQADYGHNDIAGLVRTETLKTKLDDAGEGNSKEFKNFKTSFMIFYDNIESLAVKPHTRQIDTSRLSELISQCQKAVEMSKKYTIKGERNNQVRQAAVIELREHLNAQVRRLKQSLNNPTGMRWSLKDILSDKPPVPSEAKKERQRMAKELTAQNGVVNDIDPEFYDKNGGSSLHMIMEKEEADKVVKASNGFYVAKEVKDHPGLYELRQSWPETVTVNKGEEDEETVPFRRTLNLMFKTMIYTITDETGKIKNDIPELADGRPITELFDELLHKTRSDTFTGEKVLPELKRTIDKILMPSMKNMLTDYYQKKGVKKAAKKAAAEAKKVCADLYKLQLELKDIEFTSPAEDTDLAVFCSNYKRFASVTKEKFINNDFIKNIEVSGQKVTAKELDEIYEEIRQEAETANNTLKEVRDMDIDTDEACLLNGCDNNAIMCKNIKSIYMREMDKDIIIYEPVTIIKRHPQEAVDMLYKNFDFLAEQALATGRMIDKPEDIPVVKKRLTDIKNKLDKSPDMVLDKQDRDFIETFIYAVGKYADHRLARSADTGDTIYTTEVYASDTATILNSPFTMKGIIGKYKKGNKGDNPRQLNSLDNYMDHSENVISSRKEAVKAIIKFQVFASDETFAKHFG